MNHDRMRRGSALLARTAMAAPGVIPLSPAQADPDVKDVRDEVADSGPRGYQGESISTVGQVVVSDDPGALVGQLSTKLADARDLLGELKAQERERPTSSRSGLTRRPASVPASGRAAAAVAHAVAQVGDAHVYGVGLPHSSSAQFGSGLKVAASDLKPGDLVSYHSPISHVGVYIGNGLIVHAANPSTGVAVSALYSMPFAGAVRPG